MAKVNNATIVAQGEEEIRVAVVRELLCQRAADLGLFEDGANQDTAIERLLDLEARTPEPTEAECRRYYDAHLTEFRSGDLVAARHILFGVTPGTPIDALRAKAEETLHTLKHEPERFDELARQLSNCPSGQQGGNIGQVTRGECVEEFDAALFENGGVGVLSRLINTRYGFHIVSVEQRIEGRQLPFETVKEQIAERLATQVGTKALAQYVRVLAGQAHIEGVDLHASDSPLVQ